jgi:hypothetical protein
MLVDNSNLKRGKQMKAKKSRSDGLGKLASLMGGKPIPPVEAEEEGEDAHPVEHMNAVLDVAEKCVGDIFDMQALLLACVSELSAQIREMMEGGDDE